MLGSKNPKVTPPVCQSAAFLENSEDSDYYSTESIYDMVSVSDSEENSIEDESPDK